MGSGTEGGGKMKVKGTDSNGNDITIDLTSTGHLKLTIEYCRPFLPANLEEFISKLGLTVTGYEHDTATTPTYLN